MSRVSSAFKKEFLYQLRQSAVVGKVRFLDALDTVASARWEEVSQGKVLMGTSRSGHSVSFSIPSPGLGLSPVDIVELISNIRDIYEAAIAADTSLQPDSAEESAVTAIYTAIKADKYFYAIRSVAPDFSRLGYESGVGA